jgi:hypothetical protein
MVRQSDAQRKQKLLAAAAPAIQEYVRVGKAEKTKVFRLFSTCLRRKSSGEPS